MLHRGATGIVSGLAAAGCLARERHGRRTGCRERRTTRRSSALGRASGTGRSASIVRRRARALALGEGVVEHDDDALRRAVAGVPLSYVLAADALARPAGFTADLAVPPSADGFVLSSPLGFRWSVE